MFKVKLPNGHFVVCTTGGKLRKARIRCLAGDKVRIETQDMILERVGSYSGYNGLVAQVVEHVPEKDGVVCASHTRSTINEYFIQKEDLCSCIKLLFKICNSC